MRKLLSVLLKPTVRHGSMVILDQGFLSLATFVAGILLARATTKEAYGTYILGMSLILVFQGLHRALVGVPFTVYAPRLGDAERNAYQGSALVHTVIIAAAVACLMFAFSSLDTGIARSGSIDAGTPLFALLTAVIVSLMLRDFMRTALLARLRVYAGVAVNVVATALQLAAIAFLFVAKRLSVESAFAVIAAASAIAGGYMIWHYRLETRIVLDRVWRDFMRALRTGKWVLLDTLGFMAAAQAVPWLLLYFYDAPDVAVFGVCSAFAGLTAPLVRGAAAYVHPRMSHAYSDTNAREVARVLRFAVATVSVPCFAWFFIGSVLGERLVSWIYGPSYSGYALLTTLLLAKATIEAVSSPFALALQTMERADLVTRSLVVSAVVTLGIGTILIAQFGLPGAGIAALLSSVVNSALKWIALRRILRKSPTVVGIAADV